jgi:hypothetical protein
MHREHSITDFIRDSHLGVSQGSIPFRNAIRRAHSLVAGRSGDGDDAGADITT